MHFILLMANAMKSELRYKANLLGVLIALVMMYSLQFVFFDVINSLVVLEGKDKNWLLIFFMAYAVGSLVVSFFNSAITDFFGALTQGKADMLLVRPISLMTLILFRWCEVYFIIAALVFLGVCVGSGLISFEPLLVNPYRTAIFCGVMVLGVLANLVFLLGLNAFSFVTQRQLPVDYIHLSILNFALLPATFFSKGLLYVFVAVLPMIVFASVALDGLYNGLTGLVSVYALVVVVSFIGVFKWVRCLFGRFNSVGG